MTPTMLRTLAIAAMLPFGLATPMRAEAIAAELADGAPWMTEGPMGGTLRIALFPDGTGSAKAGMISRGLTWSGEGDRLCLAGLPGAASGCMRLTKTAKGYTGLREDGSTLTLWR